MPVSAGTEPEVTDLACTQQYALCIAASCDQETGLCGACDQSGVDAGTCGACYVFDGESQYIYSDSDSDPLTCDELAPTDATVHSTYSSYLIEHYGFQFVELSCDGSISTADCMGGPCERNADDIALVNKKTGETDYIQTATCTCKINQGAGPYQYQTPPSVGANCSAVWSVG